jgi:hypothetical protein
MPSASLRRMLPRSSDAEDEVFALLKANWSIVERVTNALCRRDRLTAIELDDLITSPDSAGKRRRVHAIRTWVVLRCA